MAGNRLMRKGAIAEKQEKLEALEVKGEGLATVIMNAAFIVDGVKNLDIRQLEVSVKELSSVITEIKKTEAQIKKLEDN